MGEIRISIPSENLEYPYPICKIIVYVSSLSLRTVFISLGEEEAGCYAARPCTDTCFHIFVGSPFCNLPLTRIA